MKNERIIGGHAGLRLPREEWRVRNRICVAVPEKEMKKNKRLLSQQTHCSTVQTCSVTFLWDEFHRF